MLFYIMLLFLLPGLLLLLRRILGKRLLPKIGLPPPVVSTKNGQVLGSWSYSGKGNRMFANFQGIPYAKPPLGKLRLLRPEPVENWEGVKVCTRSIEFVQRNIFKKGTPSIGNEDALVLNIYSPNLKGNFPVLVFIHGGAFTSGSNSSMLYGGEHFMDKEVVLVAINYRLSVLGGLFLDGDKVPGNQGMRDQVLALRWIQDNIRPFGGDKDRVTIFGESAGGMSVMNHILSPMSAGLFSAAISQSGDSTSPFCCSSKHPAHYGYKLVEKLGINPKAPIDEILLQLQRRDALEIQDQGYMFEEFVRAPLPFKPIVDGGLVPDPFLPEEPMDLLRKGKFNKVPFITGTNKDEGLLLKAFYLTAPGGKSNFKTAWDNFNTIGPLAFFAKEKDEVTAEESKACENYKKKYFGETPFSHEGRGAEELVKMYGDLIFAAPTDITSRLMSEKMEEPVYQYMYSHKGPLTLFDIVAYPIWRFGLRMLMLGLGLDLFRPSEGVCHGDELFLLFKLNAIPMDPANAKDKQIRDQLIDLWTDFASTHNPTPRTGKWIKFKSSKPQFYEISSESCMKYPGDHAARMKYWANVWENIPASYRKMSSPTWTRYPYNRFPVDVDIVE